MVWKQSGKMKNVCRRLWYMYSIVLTLIRLMKSILEIAKLLINIPIECIGHYSLPMDFDTQKVNV